jgi:ferrous iron transport protein B
MNVATETSSEAPVTARVVTVALVGNPNSGKTSLSNSLTGFRDAVANYPRVTVAKKQRNIEHEDWTIQLVDLPGCYSLTSQSAEERTTRDYLQHETPDIVLNVLDAGNLDRSLFLTTQLIEMAVPRIYALNMIDEARQKGIQVNCANMATMLDGPVLETDSTEGEGIGLLLDTIVELAEAGRSESSMTIPYDQHLEEAIERVQGHVEELHPGILETIQSRWLAIKLLERDDELLRREGDHGQLIASVQQECTDIANTHGEEPAILFANSRFGFINGLLAEIRTLSEDPSARLNQTRAIDKVMLHPVLGLPIFFSFMWLMFETTFTLGNFPMDWIDAGMEWISDAVSSMMSAGLLHDVVVDGALAGIAGTIIFLPNIVILFFFLAFFSESGYLARSSFLLDRIMHSFGLHGKAFIPLVMGFGCNVPAIMATRTLESQRSRLVTILVSPFMACTARLPVFILFAGAFFSEMAGTMVFLMYMLSIFFAMAASILLNKTVITGETDPFVMELPPYRIPSLTAVTFHMWEKASEFLKKVAGIILVGSVVIWFLQAFPQDVDYSADFEGQISTLETEPESEIRDQTIRSLEYEMQQEHLQKSFLGQISLTIAPVFEPLGFEWRDTVAIMTGLVAKEVVVASYAVIYSQGVDANEESVGLREAIAGTMTPLVAFAFMVFALLYAPCLATMAVIKRETDSWRWVGFSVAFSLTMAYSMAFAVVTIGELFV